MTAVFLSFPNRLPAQIPKLPGKLQNTNRQPAVFPDIKFIQAVAKRLFNLFQSVYHRVSVSEQRLRRFGNGSLIVEKYLQGLKLFAAGIPVLPQPLHRGHTSAAGVLPPAGLKHIFHSIIKAVIEGFTGPFPLSRLHGIACLTVKRRGILNSPAGQTETDLQRIPGTQ